MNNYEEKYKEALERARDLMTNQNPPAFDKHLIETVFPELAESEDERVRKEIISFLKDFEKDHYRSVNFNSWIAWLEKQGEQPTDKIEPKFHIGDWIISNDKKSTYQVIEVKRGIYVIRDNVDNHEYHIGIEECEKSGKLWNISDAKDGDILVNSKGNPFIFTGKFTTNYHNPTAYCGIGNENKFIVCALNWRFHWAEKKEVTPATKEQRDLLFWKIHDAGYEWNSEKKELKKIESKELDADKVIEWLVANICDYDYYVKLFKKDFGI